MLLFERALICVERALMFFRTRVYCCWTRVYYLFGRAFVLMDVRLFVWTRVVFEIGYLTQARCSTAHHLQLNLAAFKKHTEDPHPAANSPDAAGCSLGAMKSVSSRNDARECTAMCPSHRVRTKL